MRTVRDVRTVGVVCALMVVAALASCQKSPGPGGSNRLDGTNTTSAATGYGATFLGVGECGSRGRDFTEVACTSERALARVTARYDGKRANGPSCPERTDFVLHITENRPATDKESDGKSTGKSDGKSAAPQGFACMRNLEPPHPGDPGGGGGPRTIVGDCVFNSKAGEVRETACDGSGENRPQFKVTSAVTSRAKCPRSTTLYVQLGGKKPVGCARPV
ncbi:hypothetical protein U9R90_33280 [Streptomyces sp. E11-3]|uniref:hypothetical protein n=1 Tax=Streptomyces sp. E11-3 TaxID=3110112 RepID=UPI00398020F9